MALAMCAGSAVAQQAGSPVGATGLCNTGLTTQGPQPEGCLTSTPVSPVNPINGGPSVDGNWRLATPYPSSPYTSNPANPCTLVTDYGPAWVNEPWPTWLNPNDGLSQWIEPIGGGYDAPGWYVYRTTFPVPPVDIGYLSIFLGVNGQVLSDNNDVAIFVQSPAAYGGSCREVAAVPRSEFTSWSQFHFATPVAPNSRSYLYVVIANQPGNNGGNPSGLRIEWNAPYFVSY